MPRAVSEFMDNMLDRQVPVLDHGFVMVLDYMGNDEAITQAARLSYQKGTRSARDDESLIRYLMRHRHTSPFEMCEIKLHIKCPIFVARQWIRHRTASVNEMSARYSVLDNEFYIPETEQIQPQSASNNQGREGEFGHGTKWSMQEALSDNAEAAYEAYQDLLEDNLTRELARTVLPVNFYTQFIWKINLHNLLHFLNLRLDTHAQWEIRQYAEEIANMVQDWVPMTWKAFEDYVLDAYTLSGPEIHALATGRCEGMSSREIQAFNAIQERISRDG